MKPTASPYFARPNRGALVTTGLKPRPQHPGHTRSTDPALSRSNEPMDVVVNRALAVALLQDIRAGAQIMVEEGVPLSVAARVLFSPEQRRASDWHH